MPFINDDQRKAAFARMRGGSSGSSPRTPRTRPRQTPYNPDPNGQGGYGTQNAVGYAGNYTQGTPSWDNWYSNFPTIQQMPSLPTGNAPSGAFSIFSGLTPQQYYQNQWDEHSGIGFWAWYANIVLTEGIDPNTGAIQPPLGTPGQFTIGSLFQNMFDKPQSIYGGPGATIPAQYMGTAAEGNPAALRNYAGIYASYLRATRQSTSFSNSYQRYLLSVGQ